MQNTLSSLALAAALVGASSVATLAQPMPKVPEAARRALEQCIDTSMRRRAIVLQRIRDVSRTTKDRVWGQKQSKTLQTAVFKACGCVANGVSSSTVLTAKDKDNLLGPGSAAQKAAYKASDKSKAAYQGILKQCGAPMAQTDKTVLKAIEDKIQMAR